jgi:hypothetical protein
MDALLHIHLIDEPADLRYEAVGKVDARLEIAADWRGLYHEGIIYYLRDGRVCSAHVECWENRWERCVAWLTSQAQSDLLS